MKLHKFRVRNYKSIVDSGDCYPTDGVTILAGKNEAGKTSLLEALEDFSSDKAIRETAIPIGQEILKPSIEVVFNIDALEAKKIIDGVDIGAAPKDAIIGALGQDNFFTVTKKFPSTFTARFDPLSDLPLTKPTGWEDLLTGLYTAFTTIQTDAATQKAKLPKLTVNPLNGIQAKKQIAQYLETNKAPLEALAETDRNLITTSIASLSDAVDRNEEQRKTISSRVLEALLDGAPNFVLFSSFDDVFPNQVPLSELATNKWIEDLKAISDLDVATISGTNRSAKKQHKHQLNLQLNEDFQQFWTQDVSKLSIDWDNERLDFWIEEQDKFYPPEIRSQGRRWHLAFYIRVSARTRGDVANIILIDEPGLYLHATAQRDILRHLESSSETSQILISTHSPYLIEPEKLDRIRLVQKDDERGTFVENKVHAVADKETLTPILTAIGLELNQGIIGGDKVDNVVVEGASDYFYLTAFTELFRGFRGRFVSGGSSGNMPKIGTILQGWGCRVLYLYDNDQAFKDAKNAIKKDWITISKDWLIPLNVDGAIEDIFTADEFAAILDIPVSSLNGKNSGFMKASRRDKVLPARLFLQSVRTGTAPNLSKETKTKIDSLLKGFTEKFDNYSV